MPPRCCQMRARSLAHLVLPDGCRAVKRSGGQVAPRGRPAHRANCPAVGVLKYGGADPPTVRLLLLLLLSRLLLLLLLGGRLLAAAGLAPPDAHGSVAAAAGQHVT